MKKPGPPCLHCASGRVAAFDAALADRDTPVAEAAERFEVPRASAFRHLGHLKERGLGDDAIDLLSRAQGVRSVHPEFSVLEILFHAAVCASGETHGEAPRRARSRKR
jgi:hypothetical protein